MTFLQQHEQACFSAPEGGDGAVSEADHAPLLPSLLTSITSQSIFQTFTKQLWAVWLGTEMNETWMVPALTHPVIWCRRRTLNIHK